MRIVNVICLLILIHNIAAQDFEIEFVKKNAVIAFANDTVKVSVAGRNIPDDEDLYADEDAIVTIKEYFSLEDYVKTVEQDLEKLLDDLSTDKKSLKEKQKVLKNFDSNLNKLKKKFKEVAKKLTTQMNERSKLKTVYAKKQSNEDLQSWSISKVVYPSFRYKYIIDEQKKAFASLQSEVKEEEEEIRKTKLREKRTKIFKKKILPKLNALVDEAQDDIEESLEADESLDKLEELYTDLEAYLKKDLKDRLRGRKAYKPLQVKITNHLKEIRHFANLVEDVVECMKEVSEIATVETGFCLHPDDAIEFGRITKGLEKELQDYKKMAAKAKDVHEVFKSDKAFKRFYKKLKNKKEIEEFLGNVEQSKKYIKKIDIRKLIISFRKSLKKIRFIPRDELKK